MRAWDSRALTQRREKRTQPPPKEILLENFSGLKAKPFQAGGGYKNPIKTRKIISTTEIFPLWTPLFSGKKSSALEQGGVWFVFPSLQRSGSERDAFPHSISLAERNYLGRTPRGSCNRTLLRRVLRRFSNNKWFLEGFLEGAL